LFEAEKKNSMIYFHVGNPDVPDIPGITCLLLVTQRRVLLALCYKPFLYITTLNSNVSQKYICQVYIVDKEESFELTCNQQREK
jgi:hypothetical protein